MKSRREPQTANPESQPVPLHSYLIGLLMGAVAIGGMAIGQQPTRPVATPPRPTTEADQRALAEAFRGIVAGGEIPSGLFPIRVTGQSTEPMRQAAESFLASLTEEQRCRTQFPADDAEWRKWDNRRLSDRQGVSLKELNESQRALAYKLIEAGLSARGYRQARDIMNLNGTLAELLNDFEGYGEQLYWITLMGKPSAAGPWGWQLDGHHAVINTFILGDQVVMTPTFIGAENVRAQSGKFKGAVVLQEEQDHGLSFLLSLDADRRATAVINSLKGPTNTLGEAYHDNLSLDYAGLCAARMTAEQQAGLMSLVAEYVGRMADGHARIKMEEVRAHLDQTYFAWIGPAQKDGVFYYRIHSPVILIEFDHQRPVSLERSQIPTRNHIHTVVRTPNGNDYGKDLLRQHYQLHPH